ncbi:MAG: L,D-transpeptidase family protein [Caulobacteraceae bacterium]|nr:L,D-transpeptidase family protein [Caulobacteraceae bacterium]
MTPWLLHRSPVAGALRGELAHAPADQVADFYRRRDYRPLWVDRGAVRPEAQRLIAVLRAAGADDLDPAAFRPDRLARTVAAASDRRPASLAHAELALARAFTAYVGALHRAPAGAGFRFVDAGVATPPVQANDILEAAAAAPIGQALEAARRMNPIYLQLRAALVARRAAGREDAATRLIEANLERARPLPADLGRRYILVNPAAQALEVYARGRSQGIMRVVVGKRSEQTPEMIGLIRYALFNPYWNVPPDLVRDKIAPKFMKGGSAYFAGQHFQALSDWSPQARPLDPATVDWAAVAGGRQMLRVRQLPGADNMMGQVKFMLPNPLGVYLHDTPERRLFDDAERADSSGCVRLQDAAALARWIFARQVAFDPAGPPDQRVEVVPPIPVYVVYLTAAPTPQGVAFYPDIYGRDPLLIAQLAARRGAGSG